MNFDDLVNQLTQSLSSLGFADANLAQQVGADVDAFLNGLTVGEYRTLVNQSKQLLNQTDFSFLNQFLNDPQFSGSLDNASKQILRDLAAGDTRFITAAFDSVLDLLAPFAASTLLLTALGDATTGGGGNTGGSLQEVIDEAIKLFKASAEDDLLTIRAEVGRLLAGAGDDTVKGSKFDDNVLGQGGSDNINGKGGDDILKGQGGDDTLKGGGGDDNVKGGGGIDRIFGGSGADALNGGGGDDTLNAGKGDDELTGGGGADCFEFKRADGENTIKKFQQNRDKIVIKNGADEFADLTIEKQGRNVEISFADTIIIVEKQNVRAFDESDFIFG